ncbi:MAG TPA: carbamoyltransferase HypF [Candidatus Sumerlaeota bacterium]|nr:carbamoyltransferase HypF [Candidatus Sumerlaeota bacterium]
MVLPAATESALSPHPPGPAPVRLRLAIRGAVQGIGFRPFLHRLARELDLTGWIANTGDGVVAELEGPADALAQALARVPAEAPPRAHIQSLEPTWLDAAGYGDLVIRPSLATAPRTLIQPDIATCPQCLRELRDPADRRHRYPFINCALCGPRFTIIESLPYDRPHTTMRGFTMCERCRAEYGDPSDRRFHAQPIACPACGPQLALWSTAGRVLAQRGEALARAADLLRRGGILALKGLGGFQLLVDARDEAGVARLRRLKRREAKPFAIMAPDLAAARRLCDIGPLEERLLRSSEAPIVLLDRREAAAGDIAPAVAPRNPTLGLMLPYTPLHHLLLDELGFPVVATSGNRGEEPICIDNQEALERLGPLCDALLVHDRPIRRHADDSIVRIVAGREQVLRRARGYAPLPIAIRRAAPPLLAVGGHLKNTVALARGGEVFLSQHIGDLETPEARRAQEAAADDLARLLAVEPRRVACDLHPDYASTRFAHGRGLPVAEVQHHAAHAWACLAENDLEPPALAVCWDGAGWGPDGTVWGGEFLAVDAEDCRRVGTLRTFPLPGGEAAMREGRRAALGLLWEMLGPRLFDQSALAPVRNLTASERINFAAMLRRGLNSPRTSSAGRLFDAAAALLEVCSVSRFEGQAAMELEFAARRAGPPPPAYPFRCVRSGGAAAELDWRPTFEALLAEHAAAQSPAIPAARFHATLAAMIVAMAQREGRERVLLTGGCFQNRLLLELAIAGLRRAGFRPYWHQRVPPGDGGLALGQAVAVARQANGEEGDGCASASRVKS